MSERVPLLEDESFTGQDHLVGGAVRGDEGGEGKEVCDKTCGSDEHTNKTQESSLTKYRRKKGIWVHNFNQRDQS